MKAQMYADQLAARGVTVSSVIEPSVGNPGQIRIQENIHVEVPEEGGALVVVLSLEDGGLVHGRPRKRIGNVITDISCSIHNGWPRP